MLDPLYRAWNGLITDIAFLSMDIAAPLHWKPGHYPTDIALRSISEAVAKAGSRLLLEAVKATPANWAPASISSGWLPSLRPAEQINHRPVERRDIVSLSAGHQALIGHRFLIYPLRTGVAKVHLKRRSRCHSPTAHRTSIDDGTGTVTDCRHRLACIKESFQKRDRLGPEFGASPD
jgi:hypothetical protein